MRLALQVLVEVHVMKLLQITWNYLLKAGHPVKSLLEAHLHQLMLLLAPEVLGVINVHLMLAMQAIKLPRTIHPLGAMVGKGFHLMINQKQLIQG
jgi:hypothetical protein